MWAVLCDLETVTFQKLSARRFTEKKVSNEKNLTYLLTTKTLLQTKN